MKFDIKKRYKKARTGVLQTKHGKIETPNLATVATHGHIRMLDKKDHCKANPDFIISNTFHLWVNKKHIDIRKCGGIHKWNGLNWPTMTDSGGFQVFSLGWGKLHNIGKVAKKEASKKERIDEKKEENPVVITDDGVEFSYDNKPFKLTPEKSMKVQWDIGADIIFAFDECTSPLHSHSYTKKSLERTHAWAERSLKAHNKLDKNNEQALLGIVQGSVFEDLRKESSSFIGSLPFDGFGIGGSFGENEMKTVLSWSLSGLPDGKPRHLLGIGRVKDIFDGAEEGIDLFDCVIPTREARHGVIYSVKDGRIGIPKGKFANDKKKLDSKCKCTICESGIKRNDLRHLFKTDIEKARRMATIHNIQFFKDFLEKIRREISAGRSFSKLKKEYQTYL